MSAPTCALRRVSSARGTHPRDQISMEQFNRHPDCERRVESAKRAIRALLGADLYPAHLRELLSTCLWKITEAEGRSKYKTRYRSRASLDQDRKSLHHEHVVERKKMIDELIARPHDVDEIVASAVGCVVTRDEHRSLTEISRARPELEGWARYEAAGVVVIDMDSGHAIAWPNRPQSLGVPRPEPTRRSSGHQGHHIPLPPAPLYHKPSSSIDTTRQLLQPSSANPRASYRRQPIPYIRFAPLHTHLIR